MEFLSRCQGEDGLIAFRHPAAVRSIRESVSSCRSSTRTRSRTLWQGSVRQIMPRRWASSSSSLHEQINPSAHKLGGLVERRPCGCREAMPYGTEPPAFSVGIFPIFILRQLLHRPTSRHGMSTGSTVVPRLSSVTASRCSVPGTVSNWNGPQSRSPCLTISPSLVWSRSPTGTSTTRVRRTATQRTQACSIRSLSVLTLSGS